MGVGLGALAVVFGLIADISGGTSFWSLSPGDWLRVGIALLVIFGVTTLFRHEYLLHEFGDLWGNEHARKLLQDGIPPYRDVYFQYVRDGNFAIANRFWLAGFVNITDSQGRSDLHMACEKGHAAIADGIIRHGGDAKRPDKEGLTPLMSAAIEGHTRVVSSLLGHDCALNGKSANHGCSALFIAAAHGRIDMVNLLLSEGADIDSPDHGNITPLMAAIARSKWDVAESLIDKGASVTKSDSDGASVMDYSSAFQAPETVVKKIRDGGGRSTTPRLKSTGQGFSRAGHLRVTWKREPA
ncbi:ankyrin repeat domain-containing protein [Shumkonia mesophila]|uniref:ankyrin repeat domain-containing protein n=1 Tax=Shumkonia mesophila TaxID=2838854 RepID=UPI002934B925|nr:ankyrin repeat domain-containing protein [Shumkonia mesophila]